jgi:transposase
VLVDARGVPLAIVLTGAEAHDVTQLLELVEAVPPVKGVVGHPRRRPAIVQGDRAYESAERAARLRRLHIRPLLARRGQEHGSGLGVYRWVVERLLGWLHNFKRLRVRFDRMALMHEGFMKLACVLICWRVLNQ